MAQAELATLDVDARARGQGRLCIVLAALLWSSGGFFAKSNFFSDWEPGDRGLMFAFWRALFAGVGILPAVRRPRWKIQLVPMAFSFAAMNVFYLAAMTKTTGANAIWLQSTAPWWVFLFLTFVAKQKADRRDYWPLAIGFCGLAIILCSGLQDADQNTQVGVLAGLASAFAYAFVALSMRALRDENSAWLVAVNHLATAAILFPVVIIFGLWPSPLQLAVLAVFGFVQMALPYLLFAKGLQNVGVQEAAIIALIEPLLLPVWSYLTSGEVPATATLIGATLILTGLTLRYTVLRGKPVAV